MTTTLRQALLEFFEELTVSGGIHLDVSGERYRVCPSCESHIRGPWAIDDHDRTCRLAKLVSVLKEEPTDECPGAPD